MNRLLITGASGFLGSAVRAALKVGDYVVAGRTRVGPSFVEADLARPGFSKGLPESSAVIHLAAEARLDACEREPEKARLVNVEASRELARWSAERGIPMVFTSTDLVFGGDKAPYGEGAQPDPISEYGRQKAEAEGAVLQENPQARVVRLSLLFDVGGGTRSGGRPQGPPLHRNFLQVALEELRAGHEVTCYNDEWRTPLWVESAARAVLLALESPPGVYHAGGGKRMSRLEMVEAAARARGMSTGLVRSVSRLTHPMGACRPCDVSLSCATLLARGWRPAPYDRLLQ